MNGIIKHGFKFSLPEEAIYLLETDPRYSRKVDRVEEVHPTADDVAAHDRARLALDEIEVNSWIGYTFEGTPWLQELESKRVTHYAESHEEWLQRCRQMRSEQ